MIITIWWEDARQAVRPKIYGPDQLLAACVADELSCSLKEVERVVCGHPLKSAGNVMRCLRDDVPNLKLGPLCAVLDHDKVLALWSPQERPPPCKRSISAAIRAQAPGECGLVLLVENMETLVAAACRAMGRPVPPEKRPTERDRALQALAFLGTADRRRRVRDEVDGFDRLVTWTVGVMKDVR
ncbi:MAG TPA: hypothetical protein PLU22_14600 [Polyangiaceae bacterium]|nr:hypothetical protein [Polyangiaceae bacterium]